MYSNKYVTCIYSHVLSDGLKKSVNPPVRVSLGKTEGWMMSCSDTVHKDTDLV